MLSSQEGAEASRALADSFRQVNDVVCQEFRQCPSGTKVTHRVAEDLKLSHEQLRTVTEVFNPGCFQGRVSRHGLGMGQVFDLAVGIDLLKRNKRHEVRDYIRVEKPGLTVISPPCQMFSSLQNLSQGRRESSEGLMNRYLESRREAKTLLNFAVEVAEMCLGLGLKFVFEHPATATSWQERELGRLRRRTDVTYVKCDQCRFGLHGEHGLHQKPTGFLTNSEQIAAALGLRCTLKGSPSRADRRGQQKPEGSAIPNEVD